MAAAPHLERPAIVQPQGNITWGAVHAMSVELAGRLTGDGALVNLCASRLGFLVTWLAALRSARPMWLPSSSGQDDFGGAPRETAPPCVVVDDSDGFNTCTTHVERVVRGEQRDAMSFQMTSGDLAWKPSWDAPAAVLHTSGSTGRASAHTKTLLQLALGALALAERLWPGGKPEDTERLLSSVAPAHMFGFEASVMLPLIHGLAVIDRRPLLAADVERATILSTHRHVWVATPMHLQGLMRSGTRIERCSAVLCSTMPLSVEVAKGVEALTQSRVLEVYGATETGALATRRTARDQPWSPLAGVSLRQAKVPLQGGGSHVAFGPHFDSPIRLADVLDMSPDGTFRLLGRDSDLLKIGGHRASLASLNLLLLDMPGLRDGILFLPDASSIDGLDRIDGPRLCLLYSSDVLDPAQIKTWWRQRVAPVFMPRMFIPVDRLPRNELGKAPQAALNALYAQWRHTSGSFDFTVPRCHPVLPGHFPARPIVPGALLLDAMLTGVSARTGRAITTIEQARFTAPWGPDEVAAIGFEIEGDRCRMRASLIRDDLPFTLATVTVRCSAMPGRPSETPAGRAPAPRTTAAALGATVDEVRP